MSEMMLAKAALEGKIIYGLCDGFEFHYFVNGAVRVAYNVHPTFPELSHFTDLREITASEILQELSVTIATLNAMLNGANAVMESSK